MLDFLSTFTNTNSLAFPSTKAVDSSGGAATDGTEFIANMVNDSMWGWQQALLNSVGMTPSGVLESPSASQMLEAWRKMDIPGKLISVAWNDDPATLGIRAIMLSGQGILAANYPELDALVYVGNTANPTAAAFYHADDAAGVTRNTAGVYLILPNGRGRVIRGLDLTGAVDPDGATRELGDEQEDQLQGFKTDLNYLGKTNAGGFVNDAGLDFGNITGGTNLATQPTGSPITDGVNGTPRTGLETISKNLAANIMITY